MSETPKKVLILKTGGLGDCILAFPLVKACQLEYTGDQVVFAAPEGIRQVARLAGIHKFTDIDTVGIHQYFSETFDPRKSSVFFGGLTLAINLLTDSDHAVHRNLNALHAEVLSLSPPHDGIGMHAAYYIAGVLEGIQIEPVRIDPSVYSDIPRELKVIFDDPKPVMTIHPGTGSLKKLIGTGPFEDMMERRKDEYRFILLTGPADGDLVPFCMHMAEDFEGFHFNNLPLDHIAYLIQNSAVYCGLDSGVSHLAALTGTDCRVVFTVTDPDVWRPYGENVTVITPEEL